MAPISSLASVEFCVTDVERSTRFYRDVWALEPVGEANAAFLFRASGHEHHAVALRAAPDAGIGATEWTVRSGSDLEELFGRVRDRYPIIEAPAALHGPGGGYGFSIHDDLGRVWRFSTGVAVHADGAAVADRPFKLSHVVLNSPDIERDVRFAVEMLGFRVRDEAKSMIFLGCNADHHSLAFTRVPSRTLNHVAFEVPSIDAVMRNAGRLKQAGYPMQWGVGRHGPGANVFSYYLDPDELPIEYTAEIQQVDDGQHRPGTVQDWERPPFWDAWGLAEPPTERFRRASAR